MSREIGSAYNYMTQDMRGKLSNYMTSLEHRYGDPRVYAQQREMMEADRAAILYSQAKTQEEALSNAYRHQRHKIQQDHKTRMEQRAPYKTPQLYEDHPPAQTA